VRLLLVSGSTRRGSTNGAALRAAQELVPPGTETVLHDRLGELPQFDPDADHEPLPPLVTELRAEIARADAVLFCTPEYAGTLPGSFKNTIDWLVGSGELYRTPAAWINVGNPGRGAGAEAALATVLGYVDADVVQQACVRIPVGRDAVGPDGTVEDADVRARLASVLGAVAEHVRSLTDRP